ncbi:hypothetical protein NECAME_02091 [Necator americanus]|uniref:Uncharacterized protein n=1 Tax=Necator americanus TaxID=51031 RepID=W2TKY5_NECAM|nr:hypothetical protein NECAME_02091 [Necator americanus]ETN81801.1 hypothetical protein NECAME_02091 [Necator americanus]
MFESRVHRQTFLVDTRSLDVDYFSFCNEEANPSEEFALQNDVAFSLEKCGSGLNSAPGKGGGKKTTKEGRGSVCCCVFFVGSWPARHGQTSPSQVGPPQLRRIDRWLLSLAKPRGDLPCGAGGDGWRNSDDEGTARQM